METTSKYNFNLGNISKYGKTELNITEEKTTETFQCKLKAKGLFSTVLNARLNLQIMTGKYTLLDPNSTNTNIKKVYVKVILKEALDLKSELESVESQCCQLSSCAYRHDGF